MSSWEKLFLLLCCIGTGYLCCNIQKSDGELSDQIKYIDTVKYIQPPPPAEVYPGVKKSAPYEHCMHFHYLYHKNKDGSYDEIGYNTMDTTIEFFSPDKDTVYYISISKDR